MNQRQYLGHIAYKITMTKNWDKKCEILQHFFMEYPIFREEE